MGSKRISLVLGSGGARGLAHIGIIEWLEANGYEIAALSGSSMGALIGGIYACGQLNEYRDWVCTLRKRDIWDLLDLSWDGEGLVSGHLIMDKLRELVKEEHIEDLSIPFTAVAADVDREKEVWLDKGPVFDAIRASMALPLFFTPVRSDGGRRLLDGGILNPVPIAPTFGNNTDITVAVSLGGKPEAAFDQEPEEDDDEPDDLGDRFNQYLEDLKSLRRGPSFSDWGMFDIANRTFDAMQSAIARQQLAAYPPDVVIEIPRNACGTLEFNRARDMIELGRSRAASALST